MKRSRPAAALLVDPLAAVLLLWLWLVEVGLLVVARSLLVAAQSPLEAVVQQAAQSVAVALLLPILLSIQLL